MEVIFVQEGLRLLYETDLDYKYHKLQPEIVRGYKYTIDVLFAAQSFLEIKRAVSLNCENLKGSKKGLKSVRINTLYRIEFMYNENSRIIYVTNISKHYKEIIIKHNRNEK